MQFYSCLVKTVLRTSILMSVILLLALSLATGTEIKGNIQAIKKNIVSSIKVKNGINYVDLDGDGKKDIVMSGFRGNINAHSFDIYSFYVHKDQTWNVVAKQDSDDVSKEKYVTYTHEGADCTLREIRLIKFKGEKTILSSCCQ